jgi:hypothetical protein
MEEFISLKYRGQVFNSARYGLNRVSIAATTFVERNTPKVRQLLRQYLKSIAKELAQLHGTQWPSGTTPTTLSRRSGKLVRSLLERVEVTGTNLGAVKGHIRTVGYGAVHEEGASISATHKTYLAIPLPDALDSRGVPRKRSAREWDRTFVLESKSGNLLIVQRNGRNLTPLYILKQQVKIPPRLGLKSALERGMPDLVRRVQEQIGKEWIE